MRHQQIQNGTTYLAAYALVLVLRKIGREYGDSGQCQFVCRIVDDYKEFDPERDRLYRSAEIEQPMTREEYEVLRDQLKQNYAAFCRRLRQARMPTLIRSWDDALCVA